MPLFIPDNMQGAGTEAAVIPVVAGADETLLLEWGHFIQTPENLLMINGAVGLEGEITIAEPPGFVEIRVRVDGEEVADFSVNVSPGEFVTSVAVAARLVNVSIGHHVITLNAITNVDGLSADSRGATSISGRTG
jgi:hypothetical protein